MLGFLDPDLAGAILECVGALAVIVLTTVLAPWLRSKAKSQAAIAAIDALVGAVGPAVAATEQVVARKLRASEPSRGSLTSEQAEVAMTDSLERVALHFGPERLDLIAKALGKDRAGLLELMRSHVEAAVLDLKSYAPMAQQGTPVAAKPEAVVPEPAPPLPPPPDRAAMVARVLAATKKAGK